MDAVQFTELAREMLGNCQRGLLSARSAAEALGQAVEMVPAPSEPESAALREGRKALMAESINFPTWCVRHHRKLRWLPAPAWWIHDDMMEGPAHTCSAMWGKRAPGGKPGLVKV